MKKDSLETLRKDMFLLAKMIIENRRTTTYSFAKKNIPYKDDYDLRKKEVFVRQFLERWKRYGIIGCEETDGKKIYFPNLDKIEVGKAEIIIGKKKIRTKFAMAFNIGDNWLVCSFNQPYSL
jgi:hypothetical protein